MKGRIQIVGRLPIDLNRRVRAAAKRRQVSLNAFLIDALTHLEAKRPGNERGLLDEAKVVEVRPIAAGNLENVAKAGSGDQRSLDALAFCDRVDDGRAAMDKKADFAS